MKIPLATAHAVPANDLPARSPGKARSSPVHGRVQLGILREADTCGEEPGRLGELFSREGLYVSHLSTWRRRFRLVGSALVGSASIAALSPTARSRSKGFWRPWPAMPGEIPDGIGYSECMVANSSNAGPAVPQRSWLKCLGVSLMVLFAGAVCIGGVLAYIGISESLQAENNLHATVFTISLVEKFVGRNGRWPRSWDELAHDQNQSQSPVEINPYYLAINVGRTPTASDR